MKAAQVCLPVSPSCLPTFNQCPRNGVPMMQFRQSRSAEGYRPPSPPTVGFKLYGLSKLREFLSWSDFTGPGVASAGLNLDRDVKNNGIRQRRCLLRVFSASLVRFQAGDRLRVSHRSLEMFVKYLNNSTTGSRFKKRRDLGDLSLLFSSKFRRETQVGGEGAFEVWEY